MRRDLICLIREGTLVTFTTRVPLSDSQWKEVLNCKFANDIAQVLVNNSIGYSKTMYSGMDYGNVSTFSMMSQLNENIHERNIYMINLMDKGVRCEFAEKYIEQTDEGLIISKAKSKKDISNLSLYCKSNSTKRYSLGVRMYKKEQRLEYKLAM